MERNTTFLFRVSSFRLCDACDRSGCRDLSDTFAKSPDLPADTLAVSVSCRGTVYSAEALILGDEPYIYQLDKRKLPAGLPSVHPFMTNLAIILADRLTFNRCPLEYCQITAETDKPYYKPLEKVKLSLAVKDPPVP